MSNPPAQKSRWGSLLSGAVAGLESRLDGILADEGTVAAKNAEFDRRRAEAKAARQTPAAGQPDLRKTAVTNSQEASNAPQPPSSTGKQSSESSRAAAEERMSTESTRPSGMSADDESPRASSDVAQDQSDADAGVRDSISSARPSMDGPEPLPDLPTIEAQADDQPPAEKLAEAQEQLSLLQKDREEADTAHKEEVQSHLERIDALQEKLKYLADEAAKAAQQAAKDAPEGAEDRQLALKDEKIALLMGEGQKLSKAEVAASTALRKLRSKMAEDLKAQSEARRVLAKAERASASLSERVARLEVDKREATAKLSRIPRLEREVADLRRERTAKTGTIDDLRSQLDEAKKAADLEKKQATDKALQEERKLSQSLRDDLANARIERELREERTASQLRDLQEQLSKEKERYASAEGALRSEIQVLESRLEVLRERSEEVSSGSNNDMQAKLLRQVETLQSQYSVASENWQILESSLQARLSALEKERNDSSKAEAEARKRARENASTARRAQDQLDEVNQRCQLLEHEVSEYKRSSEKFEKQASELEQSLKAERAKLESERATWQNTLKTKIDEEKARWEAQSPKTTANDPTVPSIASPSLSHYRRTSGIDLTSLGLRRSRGSELNIHNSIDRPSTSRRPSAMFGRDVPSPNGFSSPMPSLQPLEPPSIADLDEQTDRVSSPHRTINDMLSVQTTSAGPSVQLVERMSAAVRRLESEKAANKDELSRLSTQRDEARREVVTMMREVEQKRALDARLKKLDKEYADVNTRYQTTLEMLGEKSEQVEELEADVAELKKIYRELADKTTKG